MVYFYIELLEVFQNYPRHQGINELLEKQKWEQSSALPWAAARPAHRLSVNHLMNMWNCCKQGNEDTIIISLHDGSPLQHLEVVRLRVVGVWVQLGIVQIDGGGEGEVAAQQHRTPHHLPQQGQLNWEGGCFVIGLLIDLSQVLFSSFPERIYSPCLAVLFYELSI